MSKRRLKRDELDLWNRVAKTTERFQPRSPLGNVGRTTDPAKDTKPNSKPGPAPLPAFEIGGKATPKPETRIGPKTTSARLARDPVSMDAKAFGRMKRGKLVPEARLDLHGMTLDQAHPQLTRFILTSQARGLRLVLVITGKGDREDPYDPMPRRRGVLKQQVPLWLRMAPVAQAVLQVSEAHIRHGGAGAYYVYLRRQR
ncbi:Smr/MutS family protein [Aestuariicoccus sp. MJ-SS9]|uniref:Smr/MutS family protein n=1 Tax=Aestuariicoccus sp. MJ-SS9 TaxID=3079855 RepID=UPI00290D03B4|nr:Smr/MutS family protein [Aestuariicoccus sp. MJ-SS9]MDU8910921.1 Smr/MutS family protein [Aestuariicoccus sp. MJ-SS9]